MALIGGAAVAIWHDLLPEATGQFYQWHNREHMPERAAIPGFNRGRRYLVTGSGPAYFNLYEADSMAVLAGPDYLDRLNNPTPWTRETVASFRNVVRLACDVRFSHSVGDGGYVGTVRFADAAALAALEQELPALALLPGIAGVHLLVDDTATSGIQTNERAAREEARESWAYVVLIEGVSATVVAAAGDRLRAVLPDAAISVYGLQHSTEARHAG